MKDNLDFSDLGPSSSSNNLDFSDLGPSSNQSASQNLLSQASQQGQNKNQSEPNNIFSALNNVSNNIVNPNAFINVAMSPNKPLQALKEAASTAGKATSFYNPELMEAPGLLPGIINSLGRIGSGTTSTTAMQANNINSLEDLKNAAENNLRLNALVEAPVAAVNIISGAAELMNPMKYAQSKAQQIKQGFEQAQQEKNAAYLPVNQKYGDANVSVTPKSYLNFEPEISQYFTPQINKSFKTFKADPTFQNLHNLQSQMGNDAARISGNTTLINQHQAIQSAQQLVEDKIQSFLKQDPKALASYNNGQYISANKYFPYLSSPTLSAISEGRNVNYTPSDIVGEINKGSQKSTRAIPADHPLIGIGSDLENKINRGKAMQYVLPTIAGVAGGEMIHPGASGILSGLATGVGFGHYIEPSLLKVAQNPWLQNAMINLRNSYYPVTRNWIANNG